MRIELTTPAWKAGVLPLNYARAWQKRIGFEPIPTVLETVMLPLHYRSIGAQGRICTYGVSYVTDLQSAGFAGWPHLRIGGVSGI